MRRGRAARGSAADAHAGGKGAGTTSPEEPCSPCDGDGWIFRGGRELNDIGPMVELRKLKQPSVARYHRGYDAIQLP
jgi:hypothetical protein